MHIDCFVCLLDNFCVQKEPFRNFFLHIKRLSVLFLTLLHIKDSLFSSLTIFVYKNSFPLLRSLLHIKKVFLYFRHFLHINKLLSANCNMNTFGSSIKDRFMSKFQTSSCLYEEKFVTQTN